MASIAFTESLAVSDPRFDPEDYRTSYLAEKLIIDLHNKAWDWFMVNFNWLSLMWLSRS